MAAFELCDEALAGQTVQISTEQTLVQSALCEGDPDCTLTDMVEIITEVSIAAE